MSLRDQLLKSGLANQKQAKKAEKEVSKQKYQEAKGNAQADDEVKRLAEQARLEQAERSRELNRQQREQAEAKAIQAQIRQLIEMNKISTAGAEIAYQFADHNKVKSIYVTPKLQDQLIHGVIAIVREGESYALIPKQVGDKIAQRDPSHIVLLNTKTPSPIAEEEDPYAAYQVPDDLMW
ncbi:MAG: DUF2058 domain-containing protein [Thiofilum sp.]|uniref:DUF2058 domain-containing protein n=1 Tax=Thiofilum sp. TaxID=2212733 RepID=UPI0025DB1314|nr:DUF2058 domain-containing protein [Thiofilum sp.]MBK8454510.1 DUF2058 domain-containing protein [Thiofilum sp.]